MTNFRIKVVSDTVCPWCYVGQKKLEAAQRLWAQQHPSSGDSFTVSYQAFQLNPNLPPGPASSTDKRQYYESRFGSTKAEQIFGRLRDVGEPLGIHFSFGGRTGNTRDSHRLVRLAKKYGGDTELKTVAGLFAGYFENERDITSADFLRDVAVLAGIPAEDFQRAIVESDEGGQEVDREVSSAVFSGVSGVPDYTIQDALHLGGARDASDFVKAFERIKKMEEQGGH